MRRRLSRSIFVVCVVAALTAPTLHARSLNDDQAPRGGREIPGIVKVIKQIIRAITKPTDDGGLLIPPKP